MAIEEGDIKEGDIKEVLDEMLKVHGKVKIMSDAQLGARYYQYLSQLTSSELIERYTLDKSIEA